METRFSGVETCEMFNVSRRRWDVNGLGNDVVWMSWQALEDVVIIKGEFEVR